MEERTTWLARVQRRPPRTSAPRVPRPAAGAGVGSRYAPEVESAARRRLWGRLRDSAGGLAIRRGPAPEPYRRAGGRHLDDRVDDDHDRVDDNDDDGVDDDHHRAGHHDDGAPDQGHPPRRTPPHVAAPHHASDISSGDRAAPYRA